MNDHDITEAIRAARPPAHEDWHATDEGRRILSDVLAAPRAPRPRPRHRRTTLVVAATAATAAAVTAALVTGPQLLDRGSSGGRPVASDRPPSKKAPSPSDAAFFDRLRSTGLADEVERYDSLGQAARAASAVVVGEVVGVRPTRRAHGIQMIGVTIRPVEVVAGTLPEGFRKRVTVEFTGSPHEMADGVNGMKLQLPKGRSVWFLRSKAEEGERFVEERIRSGEPVTAEDRRVLEGDRPYYRLVCSQGLFIQGDGHVVNPVIGHGRDDDPLSREAEKYPDVAALSTYLRTVHQVVLEN
ncbi:hypothetical protein [Streptomyces sp. NPDC058572]|uniref:hypothetical protein n=1 Tax=Streptomyces sp. NPDC058572 TaxID=3346546 RepID=UPI00364F0B3D